MKKLNASTVHNFVYSDILYKCGGNVILTGPDFLLGETVKSGQKSRSCREKGITVLLKIFDYGIFI